MLFPNVCAIESASIQALFYKIMDCKLSSVQTRGIEQITWHGCMKAREAQKSRTQGHQEQRSTYTIPRYEIIRYICQNQSSINFSRIV